MNYKEGLDGGISPQLKIKKGNKKRFKAIFEDGSKVEFGQKGGNTYIDHSDETKRKNYLKRHELNPLEKKFLKNKEKYFKSPSVLSAEILWGKNDDINKNIKSYVKKYL